MKVTAIFDIGKSNKKFFLFDENYHQVHQEYQYFEEIEDEDGVACDNLIAIKNWILSCFRKIVKQKKYEIKALNFSSYGASFVHIDQNGQVLTPLYNYLKPFPKKLLKQFHENYDDPISFAKATASPPLGMLNSGLQLYWLKYERPDVFKKLKWSLHFPQYLSFLFTGIPLSEFTSIGCHTGLWDFEKNDYHHWVYAEGIDRILPPIVNTNTSINQNFGNTHLKIGIGIHDSSSALLPYLRADRKPFLLISTGTWSITLNPFSKLSLSANDLQNDCLNFLRVDGEVVRAARLFLGNEYKLQVKKLQQHFKKKKGYHRKVKMNQVLIHQLQSKYKRKFHFESIALKRSQPKTTVLSSFSDFEVAFHQLMLELVELQIQSAELTIGDDSIKKLYIDGGFADNDIYVNLLVQHFKGKKVRTTQSPLGSALGAAMVINEKSIGKSFLKKHYALKKHNHTDGT